MINKIFFDCDGIVIKRDMYFSKRFSRDFAVPEKDILPFFQNEFLRCEIGKADLKEELKKYLPKWGWKQPVDELLRYWFSHESEIDKDAIDFIQSLRAQGIKCFLDTNNEKYRTDYLRYNLALGTVFDGFFSSCTVGHLKPQTEFWQTLYQNQGSKHEILVVDDKEEYVKSARQFGFYSHHYTGIEGLQTAVEGLLKV